MRGTTIFVTGGSGFVGSAEMEELIGRGKGVVGVERSQRMRRDGMISRAGREIEVQRARRKGLPFLFVPDFGCGVLGTRGGGRLQPVYVGDVARAFVDALEKPQTVGEIYPIGGSGVVTWPQMHRMAAEAIVGKRRAVMPIPAWYAKLLTRVMPAWMLPFNRDQVIMSQEENTCDLTKF